MDHSPLQRRRRRCRRRCAAGLQAGRAQWRQLHLGAWPLLLICMAASSSSLVISCLYKERTLTGSVHLELRRVVGRLDLAWCERSYHCAVEAGAAAAAASKISNGARAPQSSHSAALCRTTGRGIKADGERWQFIAESTQRRLVVAAWLSSPSEQFACASGRRPCQCVINGALSSSLLGRRRGRPGRGAELT